LGQRLWKSLRSFKHWALVQFLVPSACHYLKLYLKNHECEVLTQSVGEMSYEENTWYSVLHRPIDCILCYSSEHSRYIKCDWSVARSSDCDRFVINWQWHLGEFYKRGKKKWESYSVRKIEVECEKRGKSCRLTGMLSNDMWIVQTLCLWSRRTCVWVWVCVVKI